MTLTSPPTAPAVPRPADPTGGRPVIPARGRLTPLGLREAAVVGGFWADRQTVNAEATLEHCETWMERVGWLDNFDRVAAGTTGPDRPGWSFSDSEVYKLIEACAWEFGRTGDPVAEAAVRRLTARIGAAQDADGYLNTCFGHGDQPSRYSDLEMGHELYCIGHLLQAAVARLRTAGPDELLDIARCAADHVVATFGPDGRQDICGHPEIEVGLAEFGRAVGDDRYVEQARLFLDRRGHGTLGEIPYGRAYFQDDMPIREADVWRGHVVRALYLSAAAVDVAVDRQDDSLLTAVQRQWERSVARRTYLTGGMGSRHQDESFGDDWELPADRAYCETCAGIASVMVSWRLQLATGDVRYADLIERTLFNVVATSPRTDGRAFFYANPLHQRTVDEPADDGSVSARAEGSTRAAWFDVSCCPTNVARTLAGLDAYLATTDDDGVQLHQYASCTLRTTLRDGREVALDVETDYPRSGVIRIRWRGRGPVSCALSLRVPDWATDAVSGAPAVLTVGGHRRPVDPGVVRIDRTFTPGEVITLELPVVPRFTLPDPRIDAARGTVAVERGPEVLCVESTDLDLRDDIDGLRVDLTQPPRERHGRVEVTATVVDGEDREWAYRPAAAARPPVSRSATLPMRPYHQWSQRGPTAMRIWLPLRTGRD